MSDVTVTIEGLPMYGDGKAWVDMTPSQIRSIRRIPRPAKSPDDYLREHEIAMLRLLARKHPELVRELAEVGVK